MACYPYLHEKAGFTIFDFPGLGVSRDAWAGAWGALPISADVQPVHD
jgi:hypothetical protein